MSDNRILKADGAVLAAGLATHLGSNVTPLPSAEGLIRERELLYGALLNALPAAIYTTDAQGRITFYNQAAVEFSGRRPVIGEDTWCVTWRLFHPDGRPMAHEDCPMAVALKEGRAVRGAEAIAERPDGTRVHFAPYPTPLRDETGAIIGAVNMLVDISHRKEAESRQALLTNEVNHRANNLLAVVQATVRLTEADSVDDFRAALEGRISALSQAHNLLAQARWESADLQSLVTEELAPYFGAETPRVWISGPVLPLAPHAAQSMAMAIHELATNAAKYGALSGRTGQVRIAWRRSGRDRVVFRWTESEGPAVTTPVRTGVGTKVITAAVSQMKGETRFQWLPGGLVCEIALPRRSNAPA